MLNLSIPLEKLPDGTSRLSRCLIYDVTSPSWKPGASAAEWLKYRPEDLPTKPCGDNGWIYSDKFYFSTVVTEVMIRAMLSCPHITKI